MSDLEHYIFANRELKKRIEEMKHQMLQLCAHINKIESALFDAKNLIDCLRPEVFSPEEITEQRNTRFRQSSRSKQKEHMRDSTLENRDYYLFIDRSGSMTEKDAGGGKSRWEALQETTLALAQKIAGYDPDGITVVPFGTQFKTYENVTPEKVKQIFQEVEPLGSTNLSAPLQAGFDDYLKNKKDGKSKANGAIFIVVTDGAPSDPDHVAKAIVNFGNKLENADSEAGISFFQIGKDSAAQAYLKSLDDDLGKNGAKHDIVDVKTFEELENIGLTEALLASLSD